MGTLIKEEHFLPHIGRRRMLRIYLPSGYEQSEQSYPVVYMHDAQNLFEIESSGYGMIWDVKNFLESLEEAKPHLGFIVVGIDNATGYDRLDEYAPWVNTHLKKDMDRFSDTFRDFGGLGDLYGQDIVETVKPFIDATYRTLTGPETTSIIGSSMGGIISLYLGIKYPNVFGIIGAFSTAVWFCEEPLIKWMDHVSMDQKIYLDIGTNETSDPTVEAFAQMYVDGTKKLYNRLCVMGLPPEQLKLVIEEGAVHNELSWARRFPEAFTWLYNL